MRNSVFCIILSAWSLLGFRNGDSFVNETKVVDCGSAESVTIDEVMLLEPEGQDEWIEKRGIMDGWYFEAYVAFSDGIRGRLFRGKDTGRYFVEDSQGNNYYYVNLRAALRALYLYKRYGCMSSKYQF
jgi:hypothetical protein